MINIMRIEINCGWAVLAYEEGGRTRYINLTQIKR
jgi:hypothetical protein